MSGSGVDAIRFEVADRSRPQQLAAGRALKLLSMRSVQVFPKPVTTYW
ncbi:hypothetical protein [Kribbella sp. NBC_00889]|nr:hypothetical protein OG817_36115 [Kribbella sp. NBC_00889]